MAYRIVLRRDTSTNWSASDPVLLSGEPGFETNTGILKIGDGVNTWSNLIPYSGPTGATGASQDLSAITQSLIPLTGNTYDLGATAGYSWKDLYLSGHTIYLGDATIESIGESVMVDTLIVGGPTGSGGVVISASNGVMTSNGSVIVGATGATGTTGADGSGVFEVTYLELAAGITGGTLIPGSYYLITDFQTCYDQPDYDTQGNGVTGSNYKAAAIEPIMVLAISGGEISSNAYQPAHPNDTIKYDWTWNTTEITGGPAKGRITERIDEYNNRTDYDHRNILFKRYKTYYYDLSSPLQGTISISNGTVTGVNTLFLSLSEGDVIYALGNYYYKIVSIGDNTNMTVEGAIYNNQSGLKYYIARPELDNFNVQIPYTHTQMTDPPVDSEAEASIEDFIMDGSIVDGGNYFSDGSSYFTNLYPGLFVMMSDNISINQFVTDGDNGADGSGVTDIYEYSKSIGGNNYTAYIKRTGGSGDPSINQFMIVNTDGSGITHNVSYDTNVGFQEISGITGATQVHYLLMSQNDNNKISDSNVELIVDSYLSLIDNKSISESLTSLNLNYSDITDIISGQIFLFNDVPSTLNDIDDGGDDMYDGGNLLYTNLSIVYKSYEYKNNNIINDDYQELTTFRIDDEIENDGVVSSINNYIGNYSNFFELDQVTHSIFLLSNNVFGYYSYSNNIGDLCYNNGTGDFFTTNTISRSFINNAIRGYFYVNTIGYDFHNNTINGNMFKNIIGDAFYNNILGSMDFERNEIGNSMNSNIFFGYADNSFYKNDLGSGFRDNEIYSGFSGNSIGTGFSGNEIYLIFYDNEIKEYFENNTVGSSLSIGDYDFHSNQISNDFKGNLILSDFYLNVIGSATSANQFLGDVVFNNMGALTDSNDFLGVVVSNTWVGSFYSNTLGTGFVNSQIGSNFYENVIGDNFGSAYPFTGANKIGNFFYQNNIGNNFVNNITLDKFSSNIIGNYFQWNVINSVIDGIDFTTNYGNITEITYTAMGSTATDGSYIGLTGSTNFGGTGSTFDVTVIEGTVTDVTRNLTGRLYNINDTITIPGTSIGGETGVIDLWSSNGIGKNGTFGIYTGVTGAGGSGINATFDISVSTTFNLVYDIVINNTGSGYSVGDTLLILGSLFGGTNSVDDITVTINSLYSDNINITVTDVSTTPSVYDTYTCQILERQGGIKRLTFYDSSDLLIIRALNE